MKTFITFNSATEAKQHRQKNGTGGWIFSTTGTAILFPNNMTPSQVFAHPMTRGLSGTLE